MKSEIKTTSLIKTYLILDFQPGIAQIVKITSFSGRNVNQLAIN